MYVKGQTYWNKLAGETKRLSMCDFLVDTIHLRVTDIETHKKIPC